LFQFAIDTRAIVGSPKSDASRRKLPLPACTIEALRRHRVRRDEDQVLAASAWTESGRLFTNTIGTSFDGDNLTKIFQGLSKAAGVPLIRFHDLRHTCEVSCTFKACRCSRFSKFSGTAVDDHTPLYARRSGGAESRIAQGGRPV